RSPGFPRSWSPSSLCCCSPLRVLNLLTLQTPSPAPAIRSLWLSTTSLSALIAPISSSTTWFESSRTMSSSPSSISTSLHGATPKSDPMAPSFTKLNSIPSPISLPRFRFQSDWITNSKFLIPVRISLLFPTDAAQRGRVLAVGIGDIIW
ncbi:unnamed protein product, partial [Linum tenue]